MNSDFKKDYYEWDEIFQFVNKFKDFVYICLIAYLLVNVIEIEHSISDHNHKRDRWFRYHDHDEYAHDHYHDHDGDYAEEWHFHDYAKKRHSHY